MQDAFNDITNILEASISSLDSFAKAIRKFKVDLKLDKELSPYSVYDKYVMARDRLEEIQQNIYQKALNYRNEHIYKVDTYEEFKEQIEKGGFILAHWDGTPETEDRIKEETKATIRCLPFEADEESLTPGVDMLTGKPSARRVLFARAY